MYMLIPTSQTHAVHLHKIVIEFCQTDLEFLGAAFTNRLHRSLTVGCVD